MSLAPSALMQLDSACELFSKAARGFRAQSVLVSSFGFNHGPSYHILSVGTMRSILTNTCLQEVMLALQEKAHLSLNEHRKGQASPLTRQLSEPYSPHDDLDELATLGGKTRLVAKKDSVSASSSPAVIDRSPTSLNPIVPLPLMSGNTQVHPNVLAYLQTFPNSGQSHNRPTYTNSSTYSMSPTRENEPRYHETSGYSDPHTSMQPMELVPGQFPSYFPVYDYGLSTESNYSQLNGQMSNTVTTRRESPENGMHNTWQDFVTQSGLGMES